MDKITLRLDFNNPSTKLFLLSLQNSVKNLGGEMMLERADTTLEERKADKPTVSRRREIQRQAISAYNSRGHDTCLEA